MTVCRAFSVARSSARDASVARRSPPKKSNWNAASAVRSRKFDLVWKLCSFPPLKSPFPCTCGKRRERERSEEHTSELQSLTNLVCRLLLEKKKNAGGRDVLDICIGHLPAGDIVTP